MRRARPKQQGIACSHEVLKTRINRRVRLTKDTKCVCVKIADSSHRGRLGHHPSRCNASGAALDRAEKHTQGLRSVASGAGPRTPEGTKQWQTNAKAVRRCHAALSTCQSTGAAQGLHMLSSPRFQVTLQSRCWIRSMHILADLHEHRQIPSAGHLRSAAIINLRGILAAMHLKSKPHKAMAQSVLEPSPCLALF